MSISIRCPACGVALRVDDSLAGRKVRCSGCQQPFTADVEPPEDEPEEDRQPAQRASLRRPAVDQPLIPKRRPRDPDEERPKPAPVWKRELMGAGLYFGCIGAFILLGIGGAVFFFFFFEKKVPPVVAPKSEVDAFVADLTSLDPNKRIDASRRLLTAEPNGPRRNEVARALANCLKDANPESVKAASEALVVWAVGDVGHDLTTALSNESPEVRRNCLAALGKLNDWRWSDAIAARLTTPDRDAALQSLEATGPNAEAAILRRLNVEDKTLRVKLCALLGRIGTKMSLEALDRLAATDPDMGVQSTAGSAARTIRKRNP